MTNTTAPSNTSIILPVTATAQVLANLEQHKDFSLAGKDKLSNLKNALVGNIKRFDCEDKEVMAEMIISVNSVRTNKQFITLIDQLLMTVENHQEAPENKTPCEINETQPVVAPIGHIDLPAIAARIRELMQDVTTSTIAIGGLLTDAKQELKTVKSWLNWAEESTGLKKAQVYKLVKIFSMFGDDCVLHGLAINVLYSLTTASSEAIETVKALIEAGEEVTNVTLEEVLFATGEKGPKIVKKAVKTEKAVKKAVKTAVDKVEAQKARVEAKLQEVKEAKDKLIQETRDYQKELKAMKKEKELAEAKLAKSEAKNKDLQAQLDAIKAATKAPKKAPTKAPTKAPKKAPTKAPKKAATKAPKKALSKDLNAQFNVDYDIYKAEGNSPTVALSLATQEAYKTANSITEIELSGRGALAQIITPLGGMSMSSIRKDLGLAIGK